MKMIHSLIRHMEWANQMILDTLAHKEECPEAMKLLGHLLTAEQIWLARLEGRETRNAALWDKADFKKCEELVRMNKGLFLDYLKDMDDEKLSRIVTYTNSKGNKYENTRQEILLHVIMHGQYHRGQINKKLRETGIEPVNVDYITYRR